MPIQTSVSAFEPHISMAQEEDTTRSDSWNDGWLATIRRELHEHGRFEHLYVSIGDEGMVDYWVVIPDRDLDLVRRLVEEQHKIVRLFGSGQQRPPFNLDFHIVYGKGRDAKTLVPSDAFRVPDF